VQGRRGDLRHLKRQKSFGEVWGLVMTRFRYRYIVSYRIVEKDIEFFDISRYLKNIVILSLVQSAVLWKRNASI